SKPVAGTDAPAAGAKAAPTEPVQTVVERKEEAPPPAPAGAVPDPFASRRALFRQFLDLAGRPPTRGEEEELFPLDLEARRRRALEAAQRENNSPPIPAQGTPVSPLPPAGSDGARRSRSPDQRARSFLVDCLDQPPPSAGAVALV